MFLSRENLAIHAIASKEPTRTALSGILVDPKRKVTVACDGKRLVEVSAPSIEPSTYPVEGATLANGDTNAFILPAQTAQEIARMLPKGEDDGNPIRYAALVAGPDGKLAIVTTNGKRNYSFSFDPIDAKFPDYLGASVFPKKEPLAVLTVNPELLGSILKTVALGDSLKLALYQNRAILESESADGTKSRAVLMGKETEPADAKEPEPESVAEPPDGEPAPPTPAQEDDASPRSNHRGQRKWRRNPPKAQAGPPSNPSPAQRALYTYLVRTRGEEVTIEHFAAMDLPKKIEALKVLPVRDDSFASWPQWRKLFLTLVDGKASAKVVCKVLNGLTDAKSTYAVVGKWIAKGSSPVADAA